LGLWFWAQVDTILAESSIPCYGFLKRFWIKKILN